MYRVERGSRALELLADSLASVSHLLPAVCLESYPDLARDAATNFLLLIC